MVESVTANALPERNGVLEALPVDLLSLWLHFAPFFFWNYLMDRQLGQFTNGEVEGRVLKLEQNSGYSLV